MGGRGRRIAVLVVVVLAALAAAFGPLAARRIQTPAPPPPPIALKLPDGYRVLPLQPLDASATAAAMRDAAGAKAAAATSVYPPNADLGLRVVVLRFDRPPDAGALAQRLSTAVPLSPNAPIDVAGRSVVLHEGSETLSTSALWVHGTDALLVYAGTTAEVRVVVDGGILGSTP